MGEWSPSHLIVAALALATIIGQAIAVLSRLKTITERLENRMDKRLSDMPTETNYRFTEMNQRFSDIQAEIGDVRSEMNQRLSEMTTEVRQLNQNHIDHLNRHHE